MNPSTFASMSGKGSKRCPTNSKPHARLRRCFCQWTNSYFQCSNDKYLELGKSGLFSDVEVRGNEKDADPIKADRIMLLTLGDLFKRKHLIGLKRKAENGGALPIISVDLSQRALREVLGFAYTGRCPMSMDNLVEMMDFAAQFETKGLLKLGLDFMIENLNPKNAVQFYCWARIWMCERSIQIFWKYIKLYFLEIATQSELTGIAGLSDQEVLDLLRDDFLNVSEEDLFQVIEKWILNGNKDPMNAGKYLKTIRFTHMDPDFFTQRVQHSKILDTKFHVQDILKTAGIILNQFLEARDMDCKFFHFKFNPRPRIPSDFVLGIGGWNANPNGPTTRVEVLNIRQQKWSLCPRLALPEPRAYHGSIVLNKSLFIFGGYDGVDYLNDCIAFDLISKVWTQKPLMNDPRCYISAACVSGKIYAIGGYDGTQRLREVEAFDPVLNCWVSLSPMRFVRSDACAVAHKGRIYVIGGFTGTQVLPSIEVYTPETNEWTFGPPLNTARSGVTGVVHGNKMYVFGGFNGQQRLQSVECCDLDQVMPTWEYMAAMHTPRSNCSVVVTQDQIMVLGGFDGTTVINETEMYCPKQNVWRQGSRMKTKRSALTACAITKLDTAHLYLN
ncbi:hypothetical protein TCAL_05038 [Tigriopus californicus]|uniref:Kelch-like protein diablo n=1 Tax=Tigriopus californicus TaxID=6832 RepID=A0A553P7B5_TIGCA|nr:kelch-like protein 10 [Tigriopus californicus]TRY73581.1 hypothetical protein TCAL_05038 [Tigriopus californicus]